VGLLSGFLQAGVPSTVGTLWSVNEVSTALLTIHFYELYLLGDEQAGLPRQQPARALRFAQRWLRDLTYNGLLAYLQNKSGAHHLSAGLLKEMLPSIRQKVHKGQGEEQPYADAYHWAAFVYYGVL
jgi:CHAT domain-containing protein